MRIVGLDISCHTELMRTMVVPFNFTVKIDVIERDLKLPIGLPLFLSMNSCRTFKNNKLGLNAGSIYVRINLSHQNGHV